MLALSQVIAPLTADQIFASMLNYLQGIGQVTQTGASGLAPLGTGTLLPSGPPSLGFSCVVQITTTGPLGTAVISISLDGGNTYPITGITIPTTGVYVLANTGVTLTFSNGAYNTSTSFLQGESYAFNATLPTFPVTDWEVGGVARSMLYAEAVALSDFSKTMANMAAGGLTNYATRGWADLVAQSFYNLQRNQGSQTQGIITLAETATGSATPIVAGQLTFRSANGLFYSNTGTGTTVPGGSITLPITAAAIGKIYNVAPGQILTMVTPIPGVACSNPIQLGSVIHAGLGAGTCGASGTPSSSVAQIIVIQITASGAVGAATFSYSTNGGATPFIPGGTLGSSFLVPSTGITLAFAGTFVQGDTYTIPVDWITVKGTDQETDQALLARCVNQWSTLAAPAPTNAYAAWAKAASQEVTQVYVQADTFTPGVVDIVVAGLGGPVSGTALAAVQAYILPRVPLTVTPKTINVATVNVTVAGNIYVHSALSPQAQATIAALLQALPAQLGIGTYVYYSAMLALLQAVAGVRNIELLTLNGLAADVQISAVQIASFTNSLTFISV